MTQEDEVARHGKQQGPRQRPQAAPYAPQMQGAPSTATPAQSGIPAPAAPADEKPKLDALIGALEQSRSSRVIVYWTTPMARLSDAVVLSLYDQLETIGKTKRLDLFLNTGGGDTDIPWRIVSLVREFCDEFAVLVPHRAASAGTLIAMGADEIVMSRLGVLGPIDPSRTHPLLPRREGAEEAEPISVQDMRHAMQFIREAAGGDKEIPYTPEALAQIFAALFDKIHPLAIGAIEQSYALSKLIGTQCLSTHMDPDTEGAKIKEIVDKLCDDYKSHSYQINRSEARKIGLKAVDAPDTVQTAMMDLFRFYLARPFLPSQSPSPGQIFEGHIAWLDSTAAHYRVQAKYEAQPGGGIQPRGDEWVSY